MVRFAENAVQNFIIPEEFIAILLRICSISMLSHSGRSLRDVLHIDPVWLCRKQALDQLNDLVGNAVGVQGVSLPGGGTGWAAIAEGMLTGY
jgi:hypothetical protein